MRIEHNAVNQITLLINLKLDGLELSMIAEVKNLLTFSLVKSHRFCGVVSLFY